jgi:phosphatidylserine/phosphatidylglycerophosphate/cardiolipin synthase-like enzyme
MVVEAKLQSSDPPKALGKRTAHVQLNAMNTNEMNTIVIPHDLNDDNASRWACTANEPCSLPKPEQRTGNEVVYFVDAHEAYPQFQCEIEKTGGDGDFIYLLAWDLDIDLKLARAGRSMRELLTERAHKGVKIRLMLDGTIVHGVKNENVVRWINMELSQYGAARSKLSKVLQPDDFTTSLQADSRAAAILDDRYPNRGSHHQKILIVKHNGQLTAFCGGMDINRDRVEAVDPGDPQHDVHCRIRGPAAWDLWKIFFDRWNDFVRIYGPPAPGMRLPNEASLPAACGAHTVQICRTFGHLRDPLSVYGPYVFAPKGERAIRELLKKAIGASKRFIYIEDQYLVNLEIARLLRKQLPKIKHLTILVPPANLTNPGTYVDKRKEFMDILQEGDTEKKVRLYCLNKANKTNTCGTYVHSKTWIFDDKFAIIGSANCNLRGYTHDSEVSAGIFDASSDDKLTYTFAHRLRMKLWAHHLGLDDPEDEGHAELADGVASADTWAPQVTLRERYPIERYLSDDARVEEYGPNAPGYSGGVGRELLEDVGFEGIVADPEGR